MGQVFADLPKWEFSVIELEPGRYEVAAVRDGGITGRASGMDPDEAVADLREWAAMVEAGLSAKQPGSEHRELARQRAVLDALAADAEAFGCFD